MRRLCLVISVLVVWLVLGRGSMQLAFAADIWLFPNGSGCETIGVWNVASSTCTLSADVSRSIEFRGDNITLDGNGHTVIGPGFGAGIEIRERTGITIKNIFLSGWSTGIWMYRGYYATIANTTIRQNGTAIGVNDSPFVSLTNNSISANTVGLSCVNSFSNLFMRNNALFGNARNFDLATLSISGFNHNIDASNTLNGGPLYYIEGARGTRFESLGAIGALYCVRCTNVIIDGFSIDGGDGPDGMGLVLVESTNNTIRNATIANVKVGASLQASERNAFYSNTFRIVNHTPETGRAVGVAPGLSNDNLFLENNFLEPNNTADTRPVSMGHQNYVNSSRFFDAATGRGNYWSRFDTPAEGCFDINLDRHCDGPLLLDVGQYYPVSIEFAWTIQNGWGVPPSVPSIVSISPTSGPVGTLVTITGSNFGATQGTSTVTFGTTVATVSSWSNTQIQATVPSLSAGTYDVVVTTSMGSSNHLTFQIISSNTLGLFASNNLSPTHPLSITYKYLERTNNHLIADVTIINLVGTWYEVDISFMNPSATAPFSVSVIWWWGLSRQHLWINSPARAS